MTEGRDLPKEPVLRNTIACSSRGRGSFSLTKGISWDSEKQTRTHCTVEFQPLGSTRVTEELSEDPYTEFLDTCSRTPCFLSEPGTWSRGPLGE